MRIVDPSDNAMNISKCITGTTLLPVSKSKILYRNYHFRHRIEHRIYISYHFDVYIFDRFIYISVRNILLPEISEVKKLKK